MTPLPAHVQRYLRAAYFHGDLVNVTVVDSTPGSTVVRVKYRRRTGLHLPTGTVKTRDVTEWLVWTSEGFQGGHKTRQGAIQAAADTQERTA